MLESIKKLRKKLEEDTAGDFVFTTCPEQHGFRAGATIENYEAIADEIEREVAERFVELPLDADGVPVRVGDVMEWPTTGETFEVVSVGDGTLFYIGDGNELADWTGASTKRHHHEPTVEDVLREFALAVCKDDALTIRKDVVDEYAQRLQLREVDE